MTHWTLAFPGAGIHADVSDDEANSDTIGQPAGGFRSPRPSEDKRSEHSLQPGLVHTVHTAGGGGSRKWSAADNASQRWS